MPAPESQDAREKAFIGRVISERYRIEAPIAKGGMGAVFRGEHLHMRKRVAIKILHAQTENLQGLAAQFEREAVAGAHISHPNVAIATDFGRLDDGSYFLVLEYLDGRTLRDVLQEGPLTAERTVHVTRQIAAALSAVHEMEIVHRDIKPGNVMLVHDDQTKLIDFGFARVPVERLSLSGDDDPLKNNDIDPDTVFGTIHYLAPEAANGMDALDARSDLYALGVMMYEMLTGSRPFEGEEQRVVFKGHRTVPPPPFIERAPRIPVPASLEAIVMRLLDKDPNNRFQSGQALIAALDRVAAAKPKRYSQHPGVDLDEISIPPPPRSYSGTITIALLAIAGASGAVWFVPSLRERVRAWGVPLPAATSSAASGTTVRTEVDGLGAAAWTARLLTAPKSKNVDEGTSALAALAIVDPTALESTEVRQAAVQLAVQCASARLPDAGTPDADVFELLASRFGTDGLDALHGVIVSQRETHPAYKRAFGILRQPTTLERATPALRVAVELRDAVCEKKAALFSRAQTDGDERALAILKRLPLIPCRKRGDPCCYRGNPELEIAINAIASRTRDRK